MVLERVFECLISCFGIILSYEKSFPNGNRDCGHLLNRSRYMEQGDFQNQLPVVGEILTDTDKIKLGQIPFRSFRQRYYER